MDSIPYSDLRANLAETLRQLGVREEPVLISRRGEPAAVLMSVAQYQRLQGGQGGFGQALLAWRARYATELAATPDEEWLDPYTDVRDRSIDGGRAPIDFMEVMSEPVDAAQPTPPKTSTPKAKLSRKTRA